MKERINKHIVATTEGEQFQATEISVGSIMLEGKPYSIAGQSHSPEDKLKQDPILLLIREPDRLVEHDRYVRKSEL